MYNFGQESTPFCSCPENLSETGYEDNELMYLVQERYVSKLDKKDADNKGAVIVDRLCRQNRICVLRASSHSLKVPNCKDANLYERTKPEMRIQLRVFYAPQKQCLRVFSQFQYPEADTAVIQGA